MQAGGIRRYQDGRNCGKMLTIIGSKVAHCRYSWTSLWEKLAFYVRNKRLTRHHCGRTLLITRWEASGFCESITCTAFKRPLHSLGDYYTGVCGFSESATAFIPYVPSLLRPSLQSLTELEVLCDERYEPVSVSNRLLDIALKGCIHLRHLDLFELPPEECRELCDIMAGLPDKLQLQTLGFRVQRSYSYEEDFVLVGPPFPYLYDATRLLLERCPQLRHLFLYSRNFEDVSDDELSETVLRHCPQLTTITKTVLTVLLDGAN